MKLTILTTGGTIDKTYNEFDGSLANSRSVLDMILGSLRLPDVFIRHVVVMHKDSLDMTEDDLIPECEGIVGGAHLIEQVMEEENTRVLSY